MSHKTIGIDAILGLFKKHLDITIKRPSVYFYIRERGFPASTGWGCPRKWDRTKVEKWFKKRA